LGPQGKGPNPDVVSRLVGGERPSNAYRTLLRDRDYRYWFSSTLISSLGDWAGIVALPILVSALTPSGSRLALFALGGVMMVRLLPNILFGPLGGVLADRYDRKRLMVVTDLVRGALFLGIAFSRDLVALLALTFIVECMSLLFVSAKDASLPLIVDKEHLTEANQLNVLVTYGSLPLGAALASVATGVSGLMGGRGAIFTATLVLFFNAVSFLLAAALIAQLRLPPHGRRSAAHDDSPGFLQELVEGLKFINDLPMVRSLILGVVGVFFGAGVVVGLGPEFVRTALGRSEDDFTLLMTAVGGGLVLGIAAVGWISKRIRKERLFPVSLAATAASATVMATLPSFTAVLATSVVLGAAAGMSFVMGYTLLQEYTRDEVRSRTFATFYTATRLALFASLGLAPFVAGSIGRFAVSIGDFSYTMSGLRISIVLGGLVALLAALSAGNGMYRALRDMEGKGRTVALPEVEAQADLGGVFVCFEGVEGSGKSTQMRALAAVLEAEGYPVVTTREPGGSFLAERIRELLLDPDSLGIDDRAEALLYAAARADHVAQVIRPSLAQGKVVLCDRYVDSSLAYQGRARGLGEDYVLQISRWATGGLLPHATVLLRLDPAEGMRRVIERARRTADPGGTEPTGITDDTGPVGDRMEREDAEFHREVAAAFLDLARRRRDRFVVVDARGGVDTVTRQIRSGLHPWLPLAPGRAAPSDATSSAAGPTTRRTAPPATGTPAL